MVFSPAGGLVCDICGSHVFSTAGFEKDYPDNPDLSVCGSCIEEWDLQRKKAGNG
jgi:hypothetical protein